MKVYQYLLFQLCAKNQGMLVVEYLAVSSYLYKVIKLNNNLLLIAVYTLDSVLCIYSGNNSYRQC